MRNPAAPHPTIPIDQAGLSTRVTNGLRRAFINSVGDLQLSTEEELRKTGVIGQKGLEEIRNYLAPRGCRLREKDEPLHERARKVFEGTGTPYISIAHFRGILGTDRLTRLYYANPTAVKSAGPLARLSREEIDHRCGKIPPLSDKEYAELEGLLHKLGLK